MRPKRHGERGGGSSADADLERYGGDSLEAVQTTESPRQRLEASTKARSLTNDQKPFSKVTSPRLGKAQAAYHFFLKKLT